MVHQNRQIMLEVTLLDHIGGVCLSLEDKTAGCRLDYEIYELVEKRWKDIRHLVSDYKQKLIDGGVMDTELGVFSYGNNQC